MNYRRNRLRQLPQYLQCYTLKLTDFQENVCFSVSSFNCFITCHKFDTLPLHHLLALPKHQIHNIIFYHINTYKTPTQSNNFYITKHSSWTVKYLLNSIMPDIILKYFHP